MGVVPVIINCRRAGKLIKSYEMGYGETLGPSTPPSDESFINEAKTALTNDGLARPPYADIQFEVVRR
jgi:hypothetical protein